MVKVLHLITESDVGGAANDVQCIAIHSLTLQQKKLGFPKRSIVPICVHEVQFGKSGDSSQERMERISMELHFPFGENEFVFRRTG